MNKKNLIWIEINRRAILNNIKSLSRLAGKKTMLAPAVKANGYGHGLREIVSILSETKIPYISIHSTVEAETSRAEGWDRKIIMVGPVAPEDIDAIFRLDLEPVVTEPTFISKLGRFCRKSNTSAKVHLKLETGTNRQGMNKKELSRAASTLKKYPEISVAGISTHFANIEDTTDHTFAMNQLKQFKSMNAYLNKLGVKPKLKHTACSAALLLFKETYFDLARPGVALYGYWPSSETYVSYRLGGGTNKILTPALSLCSRITQIKTVEAGSFIGYGCTYRASSKLKIAVLPAGYSDGIDRRLSNLGYVLIKGRRAPIRGRVCMNLIMVDITNIRGVKLYDIATILGTDGDEKISADTHAAWCQTINYEIISRVSSTLPRYMV
ncbi:MAG: alanine racemase [candidate division Zixibacteria bacterium]